MFRDETIKKTEALLVPTQETREPIQVSPRREVLQKSRYLYIKSGRAFCEMDKWYEAGVKASSLT